MISIKHILKDHAYQNIPLRFDEAYQLGLYLLKGCDGDELAQKQSIAALCALHNKATYEWQWDIRWERIHGHPLPRSASTQIAGLCAAIFEKDIGVSEFGFLDPNVSYAMDNCGMGGDVLVTPNISTLAAFIAAAAGIPMCKHGSPANADNGKYGSSDFISLICGINNYAPRKEVETCVEKFNFGYTEACDTRYKKIHIQTHHVAQLPHMNDIIGPITNPLNPQKLTRRVLGVNQLIPPQIAAEVYLILNQQGITNLQRGFFVRGFGEELRYSGMDEISICPGGTQVAELRDGRIYEFNLFADDFGLEPVSPEDVYPKGNKGEYSLKILRGEVEGPALQTVLANAAVLFHLAGKTKDFREAYLMAEEVFRSGKPYETMLAVRQFVPIK